MKKKLIPVDNEIFSANEHIYSMFSIEELEQRLQMSQARPWCTQDCATVCGGVCSINDPNCQVDCIPEQCSGVCNSLSNN